MGTDVRIGVEHLDQQHFIGPLLPKVIPFVPFPMVRVEVRAFELSPDVVALDKVVIKDR